MALRWLLYAVAVAVAVLLRSPYCAAVDSCVTLTARSTCDGVLDYSSVFMPDGTCQDGQEKIAVRLGGLMAVLSDACRAAAARYHCANLFPKCETAAGGSVSGKPLCPSLCTAATNACSAFEKGVILNQIGISLPSDCNLIAPAVSPACYDGVNSAFTQVTSYAHCEPYTGSICAGVVDYPIIVPAHSTQSDLELQLAPSLSAVWIAPPGKCLDSLIKYLCARAFLPCDTGVIKRGTSLDIQAPFPRIPCQSVCQRFARECADWLNSNPALAALVPVCNSTGLYQKATKVCGVETVAGGPDFPENETIFSAAPPLSTRCNSWIDVNATIANGGVATDRATAYTVQCPYPLVIPDERAVAHGYVNPIGGSCAIPCPVPIFTHAEYKATEPVLIAFTWVSLVTNAFMIVTWLVFPERRKQEFVLMFLITCFMGLVIFIPAVEPVGSYEETLAGRNTCGSNVEPLRSGDPGWEYCLSSAFIRQFFSIGIFFWWNVQGFDIAFKLWCPRRSLPHYIRWVYHGVVWSVCAICAFVALGTNSYAAIPLYPECAMAANTVNWLVFYLPLGFTLVSGSTFVVMILYQLFRSSALTKTHDWRAHRTMLTILLVFDGMFLVPFSYRISNHFLEDQIAASTQAWVKCLLTTPPPAVGTDVCGEHPSVRPAFGAFVLVLVTSGAVGLVATLTYGIRKDIFVDWAQLCGCMKRSRADTTVYTVNEITVEPTQTVGNGHTTPATATGRNHNHTTAAGASARGSGVATGGVLFTPRKPGAALPSGRRSVVGAVGVSPKFAAQKTPPAGSVPVIAATPTAAASVEMPSAAVAPLPAAGAGAGNGAAGGINSS